MLAADVEVGRITFSSFGESVLRMFAVAADGRLASMTASTGDSPSGPQSGITSSKCNPGLPYFFANDIVCFRWLWQAPPSFGV